VQESETWRKGRARRRGLSVDASFSAGGGTRRSSGRQKTRALPKQDI